MLLGRRVIGLVVLLTRNSFTLVGPCGFNERLFTLLPLISLGYTGLYQTFVGVISLLSGFKGFLPKLDKFLPRLLNLFFGTFGQNGRHNIFDFSFFGVVLGQLGPTKLHKFLGPRFLC